MLEGWWTAIAVAILLLAAINALIFLGACYEYRVSSSQDPWLTSTQVLESNAGSAPSVILLHGFGGTPKDLRVLAELLAAQGFRAVVPAIPDQTSTTFAYGRGRVSPADYAEWLIDLIKRETAASGQPPSLVGFSMGGALATLIAADHAVAKLVLISPYFDLPEKHSMGYGHQPLAQMDCSGRTQGCEGPDPGPRRLPRVCDRLLLRSPCGRRCAWRS